MGETSLQCCIREKGIGYFVGSQWAIEVRNGAANVEGKLFKVEWRYRWK